MKASGAPVKADERYIAVWHGPSFARLRTRSWRYLAAMTAVSLGALVVTVVLAGWLPRGSAMPVAVGLILLPAAVSVVHLRYARRRLDPLAERVRAEFERGHQ